MGLSAAAGTLIGEGLYYANGKLNDRAYHTGYDKGRSDAVKQQYWLYVAMQHDIGWQPWSRPALPGAPARTSHCRRGLQTDYPISPHRGISPTTAKAHTSSCRYGFDE